MLGKIRVEYLRCRTLLKIFDTIAAGVAIVNGTITYIEVSNSDSSEFL